jgi:hypothetical protein
MLLGCVVFLSAFLLFQLQLIVSKHLLPWFGGTPAVWTTSQMFFQVLLLGGYTYAHVLTKIRRPALQSQVHVGVLIAATVAVVAMATWGGEPLLAPSSMKPAGTESPVLLLLLILMVSVALPFFAVSTTGPLLQRWHSRRSPSVHQTYRLYALSNAGSFLGLFFYPFGVERLFDLSQQAWLWGMLFVVFAAGCTVIARRSGQFPEPVLDAQHTDDGLVETENASVFDHAGPVRTSGWLLLSSTSSVAFLATTNLLSQDVAAVPLLWVLPLAIYLLTFIICFDRPHWYSRRWTLIAASVTSIAILPTVTSGLRVPFQIAAYGAFLFSFCMLCHGELVRLRPGVRQLTLFYLLIALGGALGGIFVSVAAPAVFPDLWEFQLAILVGWILIAFAWSIDKSSPFHTGDRWLFASVVTIGLWLVLRYPIERTRFGRIQWLAEHGWTVTLVGGVVLGTCICGTVWKSRLARTPFWPQAMLLSLVLLFGVLLHQRIETSREGVLYAARNFYGVIRVVSVAAGAAEARKLMHGTTTHGVQVDAPGYRSVPTAYYSRSSGIAIASNHLVRTIGQGGGGVHFGVVGMGVGTMTAFARSGDQVRYYEINPEVIDIASGPQAYFTFVGDSAGDVTIVPGDARLSLERELGENGPQRFDLLVMDAFASDSVPVHLVTVEAFRLYAAHLKTDQSILAVNVTNRYLDLEPVVAANARDLGFHGVRVDSRGDLPVLSGSSWILLTRNAHVIAHPEISRNGGKPLRAGTVPFTDRYSNLFRVLKD